MRKDTAENECSVEAAHDGLGEEGCPIAPDKSVPSSYMILSRLAYHSQLSRIARPNVGCGEGVGGSVNGAGS